MATGTTVLDLRPGFGIGPFNLGMPICEALAQIEQPPNIYDAVHLKYFDGGLSFAFPIPRPTEYADCCGNGEVELPLDFPDGTTRVTCRVCIDDSSTDEEVGVGSLTYKDVARPLPAGGLYMEEVHLKAHKIKKFVLHTNYPGHLDFNSYIEVQFCHPQFLK
ncbi:hypothetical protein Ancab_026561 [Ancistrocladus abbreviatus]